jgi:3-dehydroquinate dehydratase
MEKPEVGKLLEQITNLYPNIKLSNAETIEIWIDCLADISYERAKKHLLEHAKTSKFPPTIADIRGQSGKRQPEEICSVTGRPYELPTRDLN